MPPRHALLVDHADDLLEGRVVGQIRVVQRTLRGREVHHPVAADLDHRCCETCPALEELQEGRGPGICLSGLPTA